MKSIKILTAFGALLFVFIFCSGKSFALGGGTQGSATTLQAISDVNSAVNQSQVQTAVNNFLSQYTNITLSITPSNWPACYGNPTLAMDPTADFTDFQQFSVVLIQELSKYTTQWLVGPLQIDTGSSHGGCAGSGQVYLYVGLGQSDAMERYVINHELGHYLLGHTGTHKISDSVWQSYNPAGFGYYGLDSWAQHVPAGASSNPAGFVTYYATSTILEDQADTYAYIFDANSQSTLANFISSDSEIASKVSAIKSYFLSVDPSMDSTYLQNIFNYANANDTHFSVPFGGPGTQSVDDQGNILWVIPSSINQRAGFTVGIVGGGSKMTTVLDGTITGGFGSFIDVIDGGTLMGSGSADSITIETGGILAPGHSPGCMAVTGGGLTINGAFDAEIGGTIACSGYDQMQVTGTVDVTGGTLNTILYNGYKPKAGESYKIIDNDGSDPVTGTFTGLPEGATFNLSGDVFKITYKGGDGNDVVLSVVSVPSTPNTGLAFVSANPRLTAGLATLSALVIFEIARRQNKKLTQK